jgi:CRP-like cAMP-binding protein
VTEPRIAWTFTPTADGRRRHARASIADRMAALSQAPLFAELSRRNLRRIADACGVASFGPGRQIVKEGVEGSVFYVILEGTAKVVRGTRTVRRLVAGEFFGELSVLVGTPRTASVVSETPIRCLSLSSRNLRSVLSQEPGIALKVLEHVAGRLVDQERPILG